MYLYGDEGSLSLLHSLISNLLSWEPYVQCTQYEDGDDVDVDIDVDGVDDLECSLSVL